MIAFKVIRSNERVISQSSTENVLHSIDQSGEENFALDAMRLKPRVALSE